MQLVVALSKPRPVVQLLDGDGRTKPVCATPPRGAMQPKLVFPLVQGDDVEILIMTKEGVRTDRLELKRD